MTNYKYKIVLEGKAIYQGNAYVEAMRADSKALIKYGAKAKLITLE